MIIEIMLRADDKRGVMLEPRALQYGITRKQNRLRRNLKSYSSLCLPGRTECGQSIRGINGETSCGIAKRIKFYSLFTFDLQVGIAFVSFVIYTNLKKGDEQ